VGVCAASLYGMKKRVSQRCPVFLAGAMKFVLAAVLLCERSTFSSNGATIHPVPNNHCTKIH
jgi:hypothetical protein